MLQKGDDESSAVRKIESTRARVNPGLPIFPTKIDEYVPYRIEIEHSGNMAISVMDYTHFLDICEDYLKANK